MGSASDLFLAVRVFCPARGGHPRGVPLQYCAPDEKIFLHTLVLIINVYWSENCAGAQFFLGGGAGGFVVWFVFAMIVGAVDFLLGGV